MIRLLVADDEAHIRDVLRRELADAGYHVKTADSGGAAIELAEREDYDVVLLDLSMPGPGGLKVLKKITGSEMPPEVIVLTGDGTVSTAVQAMKLGAYDYLTKPFKLEELTAVIDKAFEKRRLVGENLFLKTQIQRQSDRMAIVTKNPLLLAVVESARKVARSELPVLITGESGVGKELLSWHIHESSDRAAGPFIPINCGAIPDNMIESELFGHEKGAFTGAYAKKLGLVEIADHGTLFLDEIGDMPLQLQVKLLRVIETKTFYRVGGVKEIRVDAKYIFSTNRDLKHEAEQGTFRADLYYRISGLTLHIPPLRERKEDISVLLDNFLRNNPDFRNKKFTEGAIAALSHYSWPGNVRELHNVLHRTLLLATSDTITRDDLPSDLVLDHAPGGKKLADVERDHILRVLREVGGQRGKAAAILGIDPKTLYRKLQEFEVEE